MFFKIDYFDESLTYHSPDPADPSVTKRVISYLTPCPMGFYAKIMDGRIDDPNGGWKGRGIWASAGNRTPFHVEGGKGTPPKLVKFQLRPDPLAH